MIKPQQISVCGYIFLAFEFAGIAIAVPVCAITYSFWAALSLLVLLVVVPVVASMTKIAKLADDRLVARFVCKPVRPGNDEAETRNEISFLPTSIEPDEALVQAACISHAV